MSSNVDQIFSLGNKSIFSVPRNSKKLNVVAREPSRRVRGLAPVDIEPIKKLNKAYKKLNAGPRVYKPRGSRSLGVWWLMNQSSFGIGEFDNAREFLKMSLSKLPEGTRSRTGSTVYYRHVHGVTQIKREIEKIVMSNSRAVKVDLRFTLAGMKPVGTSDSEFLTSTDTHSAVIDEIQYSAAISG